MSLQKITEQKFWEWFDKEAKNLQKRKNLSQATYDTVTLLNNIGCRIEYYWDTQHHTITYQPYIKREDNNVH